MDYSSIYFNKNIENLTFQDIVHFFVESKEESSTLEFKSFSTRYGNFNANLEGVIRGICAFLNSEGGIIIWGAPEGVAVSGQSNKIYQGQLAPLTELVQKDWLINKISDSISPLPTGIKVSILRDNSNVVYVFEIQQSNYSPHQYKSTYWARLDGQTKPAPHFLVEALFRKVRYPNVEGYVKLDQITHDGINYFLDITIFIFNFTQLQNEEMVSVRLICPQGIFADSRNPTQSKMYLFDGHQLILENLIYVLHYGAPAMHSERLIFNPMVLLESHNNRVDLILSFGGKNSPLKVSTYELDFSKIDWSRIADPNYLFSGIEENAFPSEKQQELGATRETTLRTILKR